MKGCRVDILGIFSGQSYYVGQLEIGVKGGRDYM